MPYDPNRHHRRSIRLRGYDYTQPGAYFVTICTHARQLLFDSPALRRIAEQQWQRIANERVTLDAWVVMPDHVHGIIVIEPTNVAAINDVVGAQQVPPLIGATPLNNQQLRTKPDQFIGAPAAPLRDGDDNNDHRGFGINVQPGSLGAIVRSYKAALTRRINGSQAAFGALIWQRGYWERIMRDDRELAATRQYIAENPQRWAEGREDLDALLARMEGKA